MAIDSIRLYKKITPTSHLRWHTKRRPIVTLRAERETQSQRAKRANATRDVLRQRPLRPVYEKTVVLLAI